jgi:hypothetical protein
VSNISLDLARSGRYAATAKKLSEFRSLLKFFKWFNNIRDLRSIVTKGYPISPTTRCIESDPHC